MDAGLQRYDGEQYENSDFLPMLAANNLVLITNINFYLSLV